MSSLIGARYGARLEGKHWLREQRRSAYLDFLADIAELALILEDGGEHPRVPHELSQRVYRSSSAVFLVGPDEVASIANSAVAELRSHSGISDKYRATTTRFIAAANKALQAAAR